MRLYHRELPLHPIKRYLTPIHRYDAIIYAQVYGSAKRSPGRHTLHLIEGADHNYSIVSIAVAPIKNITKRKMQHAEVVVTTVIDWMQNQSENKWPNSHLWQLGRTSRL